MSPKTTQWAPVWPEDKITAFSTASFILISAQNWCTVHRSLFIPWTLVLENNTRSSANSSADTTTPEKLTPSFFEWSTLPRPERYIAKSRGDRTHPCLTPFVNHKGAESPFLSTSALFVIYIYLYYLKFEVLQCAAYR